MRTLIILSLLLTINYSILTSQVVNEVMSNVKGSDSQSEGTPGDRNEFIELFNPGPDTINLSGWTFTDGDATDNIVAWSNDTILSYYPGVIINSLILYPEQFALILDPEYLETGDNQYTRPYSILDSTLILTVGNTTLGNGLSTTDFIILLDSLGDTVSTYGTPSDTTDTIPFDPGDGISAERINPLNPDTLTNWTASIDPSGSTPGRRNSIQFYGDLFLSPDKVKVTPNFPSPQDTFRITVHFFNIGQDSLSQVSIYLKIGGLQDSLSFPGLLAPFDSAFVDFLIPGLQKGEYVLEVQGFSPEDSNLGNETVQKTVWVGLKPILITEIMFDVSTGESEWFEVLNAYSETLNLDNFIITDNRKDSPYYLDSLLLSPNEYVVIAGDTQALWTRFGTGFKAIEPNNGFPALNNSGDIIFIYNPQGVVMDSVPYSPDWGDERDKSLEKKDVVGSSDNPLNWGLSLDSSGGTPGRANSYASISIPEEKIMELSDEVLTQDKELKVYIKSPYESSELDLYLFDSAGYLKEKIIDKGLLSGKTVVVLPGALKTRPPGGLYILFIEIRDTKSSKKVSEKKPFAIWWE